MAITMQTTNLDPSAIEIETIRVSNNDTSIQPGNRTLIQSNECESSSLTIAPLSPSNDQPHIQSNNQPNNETNHRAADQPINDTIVHSRPPFAHRLSYQLSNHDPDRPHILHQLTVHSINQAAEDQYTDMTAAPIQSEKSTAEWFIKTVLPSLITFHRPIQSWSGRQFDRIIRTSIGMLITAIISTYDWTLTALLLPYLAIILVLMLSQNTVGGTLMACDMVIKSTVFAAVIDTIVLAAGTGSIETEWLSIFIIMICIFFGALWITYQFTNPVQRRLALIYHSATMITAVELKVSDAYLPYQLLATMILGCIVIFSLHCLPFPRLAKDEVIDRWRTSTKDMARIFNQALNALLSCEPIHASISVAAAREDLAAASRSIAEMRRLLVATRFESSVYHLLFPMSIIYGGVIDPSTSMTAVDKLDQQHWIVSNLLDAIEKTDQTSDLHKLISRQMRSSTRFMQESQARYMNLMSSQVGNDWLIGKSIHQAKQRLKQAMQGIEAAFANARIDNYRQLHPNPSALKSQAAPNSQLLLHDAIIFQLGRWYISLESMQIDQLISSEIPLSDDLGRLQWRKAWHTETKNFRSWSFFGLHPVDDALYQVNQLFKFIRHPSIDWSVFKIALKLSLIVSCASLIGVIPQIRESGGPQHGLWAAVTASILISDSEGMAWWRGVSRLYGTMFGGFIGYVILLTGMGWSGLICLLMCWLIIMQLLQSFPRYLYLAQLGQITAIVVVLGKFLTLTGQHMTIERFALERMGEVCIGCCIYLLISTVLLPVSSLRLLRSDLISSVQACEQATMFSTDLLEHIVDKEIKLSGNKDSVLCSSEAKGSLVVDISESDTQHEKDILSRILASAGTVSALLARQERCLFDAVTEPRTLLVPVPETQYRVLMSNIRRCIQTIIIVEPALRQISSCQHIHQSGHLIGLSRFRHELRSLIDHIHDLFLLCVEMLHTGQPIVSKKAEAIGDTTQQLRVNVASAMQEVSDAVNSCKRDEATLTVDTVPIATLLWVIVQLASHALTLELNVRRLMVLERPKGYVD